MEGYFCVFDKEVECSVKTQYKLTPESLNDYCKICAKSGPNQQQGKIMDMVAQVASQFISRIMDSQKEKEQLQYQLGKMTAIAEMHHTLKSATVSSSKTDTISSHPPTITCPHCSGTYQGMQGQVQCPHCGWT